jgi:hypothetical protein
MRVFFLCCVLSSLLRGDSDSDSVARALQCSFRILVAFFEFLFRLRRHRSSLQPNNPFNRLLCRAVRDQIFRGTTIVVYARVYMIYKLYYLHTHTDKHSCMTSIPQTI